MTGPQPLQYGCYYHIYNRGNNRENIFIEKRNYSHFMNLYRKYIEPIADTYAYCLLSNHFHFMVRIKTMEEQKRTVRANYRISKQLEPSDFVPRNPSHQFGSLFNAYAKAINKAYNRTGSLFEHPFHRIVITENAYFTKLIIYIHRNPQKHGLVNDFEKWLYSSYHAIFNKKQSFLRCDEVLSWFGGRKRFKEIHQCESEGMNISSITFEDTSC